MAKYLKYIEHVHMSTPCPLMDMRKLLKYIRNFPHVQNVHIYRYTHVRARAYIFIYIWTFGHVLRITQRIQKLSLMSMSCPSMSIGHVGGVSP